MSWSYRTHIVPATESQHEGSQRSRCGYHFEGLPFWQPNSLPRNLQNTIFRFLGSPIDPVYPSSTEDACRANKFSLTCHVYSRSACAARLNHRHTSQILWDSQTAKFKHCRFNVPLLRRQPFWFLLCRQQQKWKDVRKGKPFSPKIRLVDWIPWSSAQVCPTIFSL